MVIRYVLKRLLFAIPVLWAALTLLFVSFFVLPGDRVDTIAGGDRVLSPEVRTHVADKLGLDQPALVQYGRYWTRLIHGDLGDSYVSGRAVKSVIAQTAPASARLAFWAVAIELVVGVGVGAMTALRKNRVMQLIAGSWTVLLLAVPVFVVGLVLQIALGIYPFQHGWPHWLQFPTTATAQPNSWLLLVIPTGSQWRYLVLPAITLAAASTAIVSRLTRSGLRDAMTSDYVRGARSRGLREGDIVKRYGLRSAIVPVLTFVGVDLGALFGSAIVTERVFDWPGIGSEIATGLERQDAPVLLGITAVLVVVYVVVNLLVDLIHGWLDPRVAETMR